MDKNHIRMDQLIWNRRTKHLRIIVNSFQLEVTGRKSFVVGRKLNLNGRKLFKVGRKTDLSGRKPCANGRTAYMGA